MPIAVYQLCRTVIPLPLNTVLHGSEQSPLLLRGFHPLGALDQCIKCHNGIGPWVRTIQLPKSQRLALHTFVGPIDKIGDWNGPTGSSHEVTLHEIKLSSHRICVDANGKRISQLQLSLNVCDHGLS